MGHVGISGAVGKKVEGLTELQLEWHTLLAAVPISDEMQKHRA